MNVYIDAGNTNIKSQFGAEPKSWRSIPTTEFVRFPELLPHEDLIDRLYIASVLNSGFRRFVNEYCNECEIDLIWVSVTASEGAVSIAYDDPSQLGIDRYLAMEAAYALHKRSCIVVDAGSAITVDAIADNGGHLGGVILPGEAMMRESLAVAEGINAVWGGSAKTIFGKNTADCVEVGCLTAVTGGVVRVVQEMEREAGVFADLFITGGGRQRIADALGNRGHVCQNLVLDGLEHLFQAQ